MDWMKRRCVKDYDPINNATMLLPVRCGFAQGRIETSAELNAIEKEFGSES